MPRDRNPPSLVEAVQEVANLGISFQVSHEGRDGATKTWRITSAEHLNLHGIRNLERLVRLAKQQVTVRIENGYLVVSGRYR